MMISVSLFDDAGNALEPVEVDEKRLGGRVRLGLLREAVQMYEMNRHVCTKGHLTRAEVAGSTRKMYRQKHTGSARAGQRTVPHRRGGGMAFAPKTRDLTYRMPRKARRSASRSALLARLRDGEVSLVAELTMDAPRTRRIADLLEVLGVRGRCLLVIEGERTNVWKSARNIRRLTVRRASDVNAYDLLQPERVIFTQGAFEQVMETLAS